ncbi:MAG: chemotaxis protein CheA [Bdellovibrionota bacterium]
MDALTEQACETLCKKILPDLLAQLDKLRDVAPDQRQSSDSLRYLFRESFELLRLMSKWAGAEDLERKNIDGSEFQKKSDMSDEDAMAALAAMDEPIVSSSSSDDMSDEDAMAALAAMDEPVTSSSSDMSDEAAVAVMENPPQDSGMENSRDSSDYDKKTSDLPMDKVERQQLDGLSEDSDESFDVESIGEIEEFGNSEFGSDPEMIKDFMENASELMDILDEQVLALETDPSSKNTIEEIFRAAHTLKGAAGMFGYLAIERVMHRMENFFDRVRKGKIVASPEAIDIVLKGLDVLKSLMEGVSNGSPTGIKTAPIVRDLTLLGAGKIVRSGGENLDESASNSISEKSDNSSNSNQGVKNQGSQKKKSESSSIRVDLDRLDTLVNLVGELVTDRTRFMNIEDELRTNSPQLSATHNMTQTVQLFGRHMNEIQGTIMKVRMVPIGNAFNKFTRIVRDLSRQLGKKIDLIIEGEDTELDKTLVEKIGDPLVHLIRNSCDHGIEMPADRFKQGKSENGYIKLSARQEGNQVLITIEDNGKGIDASIIRKKGIEKGLISEEEKLSDREIFMLIFESGFSTAEQVTNISGRGVGMDVVKKQISKLKGLIDISSKMGEGTVITIQLPLTLAIVKSLVVTACSEIFAIPLTSVVESIRISPKEIQHVGTNEVIKRRNEVLPIFYLEEILNLRDKNDIMWYGSQGESNNNHLSKKIRKRDEKLFVVVVGTADRKFGVVVDKLLNQQEMVIKPMGSMMADIPCIAGGSILGNGEVVLVLDTAEMDAIFRNRSRIVQQAS